MKPIKIMIPIRSSVHQLQLAYAKRLEQAFTSLGHEVSILNLDAERNSLYLQAYMEKENADLLVTVDCSGFELELLGDDLFYNSLCIPAMHFLTKAPWELGECLEQRMNFTMEFYTLYEEDGAFIEKYCGRVPKVHVIPELVWEPYHECADKIKGFGEHSTHSVAVIWDYINSRDQMAQIRALPQVFSAIAIGAIKKREQNAFLSPWRFLEEYLLSIQFQVTKEEFAALLLPVSMAFDYQETVELEKTISNLCLHEIPVYLYGSGWREEKAFGDINHNKKFFHVKASNSLNFEEIDKVSGGYSNIIVKSGRERGERHTPYTYGVLDMRGKELFTPYVFETMEFENQLRNKKMKAVSNPTLWTNYLQEELDRILG